MTPPGSPFPPNFVYFVLIKLVALVASLIFVFWYLGYW
ncbi:hypothetical protein A33M_1251 [Rhodovulum sp. PH10]|nr:hypothetical protein A33M_1251 [Rhodovulum sp. PH10]